MDKVVREGTKITVRVGDVLGIREYSDPGHAKRAEKKLLMSEQARLNFFRPVKTRTWLKKGDAS